MKFFIPVVNHSLKYNPSIDGLRGIAVVLVLVFHIWPELFSFGYVGVDIFFVLSGFLITKIIYTKLESNTFSFIEFYRNRIRRIFPAMIVVVLFSSIIGYLFLFPDELSQLGKHIKSSVFFYQNFRLINEVGYWDDAAQLKPLLHFWSLSIEEQFYLFWPLILILLYKTRIKLLYSLLGIFLLFFIIPLSINLDLFYNSFSRFWELSFGGLICLFVAKERIINFINKFKNIIILLFFISVVFSYENLEYNTFKTFVVVLMSGLLIVILLKNPNIKFFSSSLLVFLGLISFPLYLWHYVFISYAHILGYSVEIYGILIIFISILVSYLTYRYIELYSRKQKSYKFILSLLLIVVSIGYLGNYLNNKNGLEKRKHLVAKRFYKKQFKRTVFRDENGLSLANKIMNRRMPNKYIRSTTSDINAKFIALIGDSHAHALYDGFSKVAKDNGYETLLLANSGCPPLLDGHTGRNKKELSSCKKQIDEIYLFLNNVPNLKKVVMSTRGPVYLENIGYGIVDGGGKKRNFYTKEYFENKSTYNLKRSLFSSFDKTFEFFDNKKIDFFYMLENPELGFHPKNCQVRPFSIGISSCKTDYTLYIDRMNEYRTNIKSNAIKYEHIKIYDPEKLFCDKEYCYAVKNKKMLYSDDDHLSIDGSYYVSQDFIKLIMDNK